MKRDKPSEESRARGRGLRAEARVESFLVTKGWLPLARNHVVRGGEVDLVAQDGATVVFVEVKARKRGAAVDGLASVTAQKQRRIVRAAQDFVTRAHLEGRPIRFDVIAFSPRGRGAPEIVHVENAFDASVADERDER